MSARHLPAIVFATMVLAGSARAALAPDRYRYTGGDGFGRGQAVVVENARNDKDFRRAVTLWLDRNLPGSREEKAGYEIGYGFFYAVDVLLPDGQRRVVYFDLSKMGK